MKKLLALILCVMMFVSVIPTMAFATEGDKYDTTAVEPKDDPKLKADLEAASAYKKQIEKMIENTKKNVATAYGVLAMDQVVYSSAKSMDDVIGGLVDRIADGLLGKTVPFLNEGKKIDSKFVDQFKNDHKKSVRAVLEDIIVKELEDTSKYMDKDNKIDPLKYGQAVANAVNKALNDKDFQAGYQAVATMYGLLSVADSINDELKKQRDEFKASIDTSFDEDFAEKYPNLYNKYINTLDELPEGGEFDADNFPWTAYVTPYVGEQS
jgi:citrate lyase gamma subunit